MRIDSLDHIALWVSERDAIADEAVRGLGMHVIDRTEKFTLIGSDARRGKLTLFEAEGPRERGALKHIGLRVNDLAAASEQLGAEESPLSEGLVVRLVEAATEVDYDLDHVALYSRDPAGAAQEYLDLGFAEASPGPDGAPRVEAAGAYVEFHEGDPTDSGRPLLNHLAVLVPSADDLLNEARHLDLQIADVVDAENTKAVFVWGPEGVKIEYVEHKATFSLV